MSNFQPYSSYISSLNSLSPDVSPNMNQEDLAEELSLWTNAQFTFDMPPGIGLYDDNQFGMSKLQESEKTTETEHSSFEHIADFLDLDVSKQQKVGTSQQQPSLLVASPNHNIAYNTTSILPSQPRIAPAPIVPGYKPLLPNHTPALKVPIAPARNHNTHTIHPSAATNNKRKIAALGDDNTSRSISPTSSKSSEGKDGEEEDPELSAKVAAEEDKRRRNTAASARFRIKKKQREQALEHTAREMTQKAETLEGRVKELEMEVKWLRGLIVEKDSRLLDLGVGAGAAAPLANPSNGNAVAPPVKHEVDEGLRLEGDC
ncbi:hypothetical protein BZG36_04073 [Bifiguratus adelaidae]|uniref:BZIP domain-containing protein n=1 Tax=Bifiguratus adelaidae TaxID=1938954 RepID=A0A261XXS1_9FUNG|nr:hypothetical protein BZG36_04073 [Bifiguratus adelaidae]